LQISIYKGDKSQAEVVCTTGVDGKLVLWDVKKAAATAGFPIV
jgi:hypothetical protein